MTHPHAEILRAIADGVPLSEFEVRHSFTEHWIDPTSCEFVSVPANWHVRRKQRTHVVNGFTVPAPLDKELSSGDFYFMPSLTERYLSIRESWGGQEADKRWLERGLCFATEEAAIANAKAMLKIDPESA